MRGEVVGCSNLVAPRYPGAFSGSCTSERLVRALARIDWGALVTPADIILELRSALPKTFGESSEGS